MLHVWFWVLSTAYVNVRGEIEGIANQKELELLKVGKNLSKPEAGSGRAPGGCGLDDHSIEKLPAILILISAEARNRDGIIMQ